MFCLEIITFRDGGSTIKHYFDINPYDKQIQPKKIIIYVWKICECAFKTPTIKLKKIVN